MNGDAKMIMIGVLRIYILVLSPMVCLADPAASLRIQGHVPTTGTVNIRVFQTLDNPYGGPVVYETNLPVHRIDGPVPLPSLPEGNYTVRVLADANDDGRMNSNAFGVPTESAVRTSLTTLDGATDILLEPAPADSRAWGAGVMVLTGSNPYRGGDRVFRVLPLLTYVGEKFYVVGPGAGYNLVKNRWVSANVIGRYIFSGDAFDDSPFLDGMDKRRDTLMGGFNVNLRGIGKWRMELSAVTDVFGRHDGQEIDLSISYQFRRDRWSLTPGAGMFWRSADYNDYYYGVREDEATDGRPAYEAGASFEFFAGLFGRVEISDRWSILANARIEALSDEIRDSPIVDKDYVSTTFLGLNYAF